MISPIISTLINIRQFLPYAMKCGPAWFRRLIFLDLSPLKRLRQMRDIVDVMEETSEQVFNSKKEAFLRGDEAVLNQVGKGKDILSILCALPVLFLRHTTHKCVIEAE
jgi:hypothetical protein